MPESLPNELKFLLDANLGRTVKTFLEKEGFDTKWVLEMDPTMDDENILTLARNEQRILITVDKDFGELVFHHGLQHRGVIRLEDALPYIHVRYLRTLLKEHRDQLMDHFIVGEGGQIRIRSTF